MYPGVKAGTVWILSNGWYLTKSTAGLVYGGVIYLKDKWNSNGMPDEVKFPFASARSTHQVYGSVKGAILSLYDRSKYYGNGLYKLYKPGMARLPTGPGPSSILWMLLDFLSSLVEAKQNWQKGRIRLQSLT